MNPDDERELEAPKQVAVKGAVVSPPPVRHLEIETEPPTGQSTSHDGPPDPTVVPPPPQKPKKRKRGLLLILLLLVILLGVGVGAYMVLNKPKDKEVVAKTSTDAKKKTPKESAAKLLVEEVKAEISGQDVTAEEQLPPAYKPSGYDFYVYPQQKYSMNRTGTQAVVEDSLTSIRELLNKKGYTEDIKQAGDKESMFIAHATGDDVLCYVYDMKPASPSATDIRFETGLSCADKSSYAVTAKELKPYVDVYAEKSEESITNSLFNGLEVEKSSVNGYARATVGVSGADFDSVGGFAALFYQTPDKLWHFFIGTQNIVPCSDYNSVDLKKAYQGEPCFDTATNNEQSTVSL